MKVTVISKTDKGEFTCTCQLIQDWTKEYLDNEEFGVYPEPSHLRNVMLNFRDFRVRRSLDGEIECRNVLILLRRRFNYMLKELNERQVKD
jgi:hypothetical protein